MHRQRAAGVRRKGCGDAARPRQSLAGAAPHLEGAGYSGLAKGGVAASSAGDGDATGKVLPGELFCSRKSCPDRKKSAVITCPRPDCRGRWWQDLDDEDAAAQAAVVAIKDDGFGHWDSCSQKFVLKLKAEGSRHSRRRRGVRERPLDARRPVRLGPARLQPLVPLVLPLLVQQLLRAVAAGAIVRLDVVRRT